jgi:hypothetical protein
MAVERTTNQRQKDALRRLIALHLEGVALPGGVSERHEQTEQSR